MSLLSVSQIYTVLGGDSNCHSGARTLSAHPALTGAVHCVDWRTGRRTVTLPASAAARDGRVAQTPKNSSGTRQMHIPPSVPTETMVFSSGETLILQTAPLCASPS